MKRLVAGWGWMALAAALLLAPAAARAQTAAPDSVRAGSARADSLRVDSVDVRVGPVVVDSAAQARLRAYTGDLADPLVAAQALALGLYDHARTQPEEWGGGADALGKRVLSRAGGHVVTQSVRHGMAAVLNRSTEYRVCGCAEPERRAAHALFETFTDYDAQGRARVSTPFLAGTYAGALAPLLWHPDADAARALQSGTLALVFAVAGNVVRELLEP